MSKPLCKDCKHFSEHVRDSRGVWQTLPSCRRPGLTYSSGEDLVFGEASWREAMQERMPHKDWAAKGVCGPDGQFFERSNF